ASRGPALPAVEQVLAQPDGVEPEVLDRPDHVEELRPADLALDLGELDPDLEGPPRHQPPAATAAAIARRWSGVLPQQPPTIVAPASRISSTWPAIVSGSARYTARMSTSSGIPAFDLATSTTSGRAACILAMTGISSS